MVRRRGGLWMPVLALIVWAGSTATAAAAGRDLHAYWDGRCKDCHGDAGAFARRTLRVEAGRLVGTHHVANLEQFLHNHYLAEDLVAPVMQMLQAQATASPVFKEQCSACHGSASEFARQALALQDGTLIGRTSQRPVQDVLRGHGGLAPQQVMPMVKTLERVLGEVGARP
jgi:mono/diheme cytochrome c family protein